MAKAVDLENVVRMFMTRLSRLLSKEKMVLESSVSVEAIEDNLSECELRLCFREKVITHTSITRQTLYGIPVSDTTAIDLEFFAALLDYPSWIPTELTCFALSKWNEKKGDTVSRLYPQTRYGKRERLGPTIFQTFTMSGTDSPGLKEVTIQPKKVIGVPSYLSTICFKDMEAEYQVSKARKIDIVATHTNQKKTTPAPAEPSAPSPSHDTESAKEKADTPTTTPQAEAAKEEVLGPDTDSDNDIILHVDKGEEGLDMSVETLEETGSPEKTLKDIPTQPFNELYANKNPAISKLKQSKRVDKVLVSSY